MKLIIFLLSSLLLLNTAYAQNNVYIIHGYGAKVDDHWFDYIEENLQDKNTKVVKIALPNSSNPNLLQWKQTLKNNVAQIDQHTFFVAHSLGCITLLDFLSELDFQQIGGVVCVSGFSNKLAVLPQLDSYIAETNKDFSFKNKILNRKMFISSNDQYVPTDLSISLAEKLEFPYEIIPNAGHFLASDGYREFPQLLDWLQMVIGGVEAVGDSNDSAKNQSR